LNRLLKAFGRRRWLPTLLWAVAIFLVSSVPELDTAVIRLQGCDKMAHFVEYFVLGWALRYWSRDSAKFLAGGIAFAALDEFHQRYVPGREMNLWDFVADAAGVTAGFVIAGAVYRRRARERARTALKEKTANG
jgi:VanZ family protein